MKKCAECSREIRAYFVRCQHCGGLPRRENLVGLGLPDSLLEESRANHEEHVRENEALRQTMLFEEETMERQKRQSEAFLAQQNVASRQQRRHRMEQEQLVAAKKGVEMSAWDREFLADPPKSKESIVRSTHVSYCQSVIARKWEQDLDEASEELIPGAHLQSHYVVTECVAHDAIRVSTRSNDILIDNYDLETESAKPHRNRILFNLAQFLAKAHYPLVLQDEPIKIESVAHGVVRDIELPVTISSEQYDRYNGARLACQRALEISDRGQLANQIQQQVADRFGMMGLVCQMTIRLARDAAEALMIELL